MSVMTSTAPTGDAANPVMGPVNFVFLQKHVHQATGIVLDSSKGYLLEARIAPLLGELRIDSIDSFCKALTRDPLGLASRRLVDAITTNETLFFRDFATFEALRKEMLPELVEKSAGRKLRIWSAAASSGQEAYSLAIMLLEMGLTSSQVEIIGTDISDEILQKARLGKYVQFEVNRGLPSSLLMKYFDRAGLEWQVKSQVRQMVTFKQADLRKLAVNTEKFDLILCRNVLIYFDQETKQQILNSLVDSLPDHGALVLGCAETLINAKVPLHRRIACQAAFYMK